MTSSPPTSTPIPITSNNRLSPPSQYDNYSYSPRTTTTNALDQEDNGVTCPPAFLPRPRQNSQIQLDVFHHPAELHTPRDVDLEDPFNNTEGSNTSPQIDSDSPSFSGIISFDNARSPVLAIHHSRGPISPEDEDEGLDRTISGLSLSQDGASLSRRMSSVASDTTYVPMTPLPNNCCLSFLDRPREMSALIHKNADLFTIIEHTVPPEKYEELQTLWKTPREIVSDEDWVQKTRSYIAMDRNVEEGGGAVWARWKELIGWESDEEGDESDEYDWDYQPQDTSLHQRWSELDKARAQGEDGLTGGSFGSGIGLSGLSGVGTGLSEIKEGEEEEFEDGERPTAMGGRTRRS